MLEINSTQNLQIIIILLYKVYHNIIKPYHCNLVLFKNKKNITILEIVKELTEINKC